MYGKHGKNLAMITLECALVCATSLSFHFVRITVQVVSVKKERKRR